MNPVDNVDALLKPKRLLGRLINFSIFAMALLLVFAVGFPRFIRASQLKYDQLNELIAKEIEKISQSAERESRDLGFGTFVQPNTHMTNRGARFRLEVLELKRRHGRGPLEGSTRLLRICVRTTRYGPTGVEISNGGGRLSQRAAQHLADVIKLQGFDSSIVNVDGLEWAKRRIPPNDPPPAYYAPALACALAIRRNATFVLGLFLIIVGLSRTAIPGTILCGVCKYDLRGSVGQRCPECGQAITPQSIIVMTTPRRPIHVIIGLGLIVVGFLMHDALEPLFAVVI